MKFIASYIVTSGFSVRAYYVSLDGTVTTDLTLARRFDSKQDAHDAAVTAAANRKPILESCTTIRVMQTSSVR